MVLDKLTYAGRRENLPDGVPLVVGAIEDPMVVREAMEGVDAVVNFAAESHVDRSIADQDVVRAHPRDRHRDPARRGARAGRVALPPGLHRRGVRLDRLGLVHRGARRSTRPRPTRATKAAGDLLVSAHAHTYGIEAVICRGSNNYGPRQYPEKLIPLMILNAMHGDSLPVYGDGRQVRNWLFVEDFCRGIHTVLERGRPGQAYNVGGPDECENLEVVQRILELTGARRVADRARAPTARATTAATRSPRRSCRAELGWEAQVRFAEGLRRTVDWYRDNEAWWEPIRSGEYREYYERHYGRALG